MRKRLEMSLVAAQTFVQTEDAAGVELAVAEALAEWAEGVGPMPMNAEGVLLPSPDRRLVLLPPVEGFIAVIEENGRLDRSLARSIAARTGARVLAMELEGHFLAAVLEIIDPDGGDDQSWSAGERPDDELMPYYVDAEAELYDRLVDAGVPAALIATDWEEMIDTHAPVHEGVRLRAEAGVPGVEKTILPFGDIASSDLVGGPRVRPDLWVAGPDGAAQVIEGRRLTGQWHPGALECLAAVEERQLERILGTLAWTTDQEALPRVVFRYEGLDDEDAFLEALDQARAERPRLAQWVSMEWLSVKGLRRALAGATERMLPEFEVGRICGERVEFRHSEHPNASFFVSLRELWASYREEPDALPRLCALLLIQAREEGALVPAYTPSLLFPLLLGDDAPGLAQLAVRPLTPGVWVALGHDSGRCIQPLTREALAKAHVGFDDALDLAVAHLDRATEENDEFVLYEQPEGQTLYAEFPDVASAARLLSPAVLSHVSQQLGDECFIAIPARDILVACEATVDARRWLEHEVARRYAGSSLPLTRMIWSIQNGELVEDRLADPRAADRPGPLRNG